ncbi:MAG: molybdopterin molybdotransferase MoeA [Rhizobiaceae bacterium]
MTLLPVAKALDQLLETAATLPAETVALADAAGRVLARPVVALRTQPPFPASAMDGYAVRAADLAAVPARLRVIGEAPAGHGFSGSLGAGEAVRIFTGAPVPDGADAILIQENAELTGPGEIEARQTVSAGLYVRRAGLDFAEGETLLTPGRRLDAAALSVAAAANHTALDVVRRPRVAILATGDELLPPGSEPGPDQIIASNSYGVAAIVAEAGAMAIDLGIAPDRRDAISNAVDRARQAGADVIVTLGGASVGDHDLVREVLETIGMRLDFWKIAMRPGKPLMVGRLAGTHVLGLPGNPVSSIVCSHLFLVPLLAALGGRLHRPDIRDAVVKTAMTANDEREDYVRARVTETENGLEAEPFGRQDSSMLKVLAEANGLIVRPVAAPAAARGDSVRVLMLRAPERDFAP